MAETTRILVIDDSPLMRSEIARILAARGHAVVEAASGMEACARATEAIRLGAYDYVSKPVDPEDLALCVRRALGQSALTRENQRLVTELRSLNENLGRLVEERTVEVERAHAELQEEHGRLEAAYARLRDLDDLKTKFVAVTSHELRTPLAIITGLVDGLGAERLEASRRARVLEAVQRSLDRLAELVARITDVAHLSATSVRYHRAPVALAALVGAVAEERPRSSSSGGSPSRALCPPTSRRRSSTPAGSARSSRACSSTPCASRRTGGASPSTRCRRPTAGGC